MPRDSISASTSLRVLPDRLKLPGSLLSTYAIPSSLDLSPEMEKAPAATRSKIGPCVAAEAASPLPKLGAVYSLVGRKP